jgi:hypothetical protein
MLDQPDAVEPKSVGKLDLLEGVGQEVLIVAGSPWSGQLMLVEQAETHEASWLAGRCSHRDIIE